MRRWIAVPLALVVLAAIAGAGYLGFTASGSQESNQPEAVEAPATVAVTRGDVQQTVTAPGQLVGTHERVLSLPVGGTVAEINVRPGDRVKAGARLAALDTAALQSAVRQESANYLVAQAQYSQTVKGPSADELKAARASLASAQAAYGDLFKPPSDNAVANLKAQLLNAEAALKRAQASYDRAYASDPAGIGGRPEGLQLEQATNDYNAARANYDKAFDKPSAGGVQNALSQIASAQQRLSALAPVSETIATAQAQLDRAYLAWQQAQASLDKAVLLAPADGVVLEVKPRAGESVGAGQEIVLLSDPTQVEAYATVLEEDLVLVQPGQSVDIFFDAAPDASVKGRVARINPLRIAGDRPLYPIYIAVDELPAGVVAGMTTDCSVIIAQRTGVLQLPRALAHAGADGRAQVKVWSNGHVEQRAIKVGLRGDVYVEVLEGLSEGEQVVSE